MESYFTAQSVTKITSNDIMRDELERISLDELMRNTITSFRVVGVPADIRTELFPSTSPESYVLLLDYNTV